jgi:hypothetical protein
MSSSGNLAVTTLQDGSFIGAPGMYTYISGSDTVATIAAADYFASQASVLNVGDFILVVGSDTEISLNVAAVSVGPPPSVVTVQAIGIGDVDGPAGATANALVRFNGVTGKIIKNGVIVESDLGDLSLVRTIENASGTIALPSYTFTGDTDSGLWRSAANTLDMSTNAFRVMQWAASPALSVNYHVFTASATTLSPSWTVAGTDANIDAQTGPKGTGSLSVRGATNAGSIKLWNQANTFWTKVESAAVASNITYTLPLALPTSSGQVLSSTTAGVTSWVNNATDNWIDQTTTPKAMVASEQYSANTAGLLTFTMPAAAAFGDVFEVAGQGAGGWLIQMNAGQTANLNGTPTTVAGSLASTNRYNCIKLLCTVANTTFTVVGVNGVITVA